MIDTRCESRGLYYLQTSTHVGMIMDFLSLIHARLGHPSLFLVMSYNMLCLLFP